jgi:hypothetical protein
MSAKIHYLTPKPEPIGHFIRIGPAHHQLETLHSSARYKNRGIERARKLPAIGTMAHLC